MLRVLADQASGALFQGVGETAFPDAGDARVGFDGHYRIGLIEQRIGIGRRISADARDLHFGQRGAE